MSFRNLCLDHPAARVRIRVSLVVTDSRRNFSLSRCHVPHTSLYSNRMAGSRTLSRPGPKGIATQIGHFPPESACRSHSLRAKTLKEPVAPLRPSIFTTPFRTGGTDFIMAARNGPNVRARFSEILTRNTSPLSLKQADNSARPFVLPPSQPNVSQGWIGQWRRASYSVRNSRPTYGNKGPKSSLARQGPPDCRQHNSCVEIMD